MPRLGNTPRECACLLELILYNIIQLGDTLLSNCVYQRRLLPVLSLDHSFTYIRPHFLKCIPGLVNLHQPIPELTLGPDSTVTHENGLVHCFHYR